MALLGDVGEIRRAWRSLSWFARILLVAMLMVSVLSISSLADLVFEFKGFIAEAIGFYRAVVSPVREWVSHHLPFDDAQAFIDLIVSVNLLAAAETHAFMMVMPIKRWSGIRNRARAYTLLFNWVFIGLLAAILAWLTSMTVATVLFAVVFPATYLVRSGPMLWLGFSRHHHQYRQELIAGGYMAAVYLAVAILAGVSEGLSRSL